MAIIRTVRGDISPEALGVTYMHEHLFGYSFKPDADMDLRLDSEAAATTELHHFRMAGGQAVVEMSPGDYNRSPLVLKRLSEATGVHIVSVSGFIKGSSADPFVTDKSINQIADELTYEITEGIGDTGIKAGLLKAGSSLDKITPNEEKIFRAVARAQRETGALISTHTEAGTMALEQVELLRSEGVTPERILIGHTDRRLDWDYHLAIANKGVTLGYDQFSKEKYFPDSQRVDFLVRMIKAGFGKQIAISGDLARRSDWTGYGGGPGYTFILWRIIPWLRKKGLTTADIQMLMVDTPRRLLSIGD
ncbi:MAG: phosphotriesterase-related protein [Chloroflexi bacterium]|nr:phosphotriesterase-related protein [Chloroflexota bacterium]MCC6891823.1 phosphotriesterase-related protein [Anaerolineae bacterium]